MDSSQPGGNRTPRIRKSLLLLRTATTPTASSKRFSTARSKVEYGRRWRIEHWGRVRQDWRGKEVPLPPGEGGAKRRVRARMDKRFGCAALIRRFAPPSPEGRRTR